MSGPIPMPIPIVVRALLGTMPDRCLAMHSGVSLSTIARWRYALRVPAHGMRATTQRYLAALAVHPCGATAHEIATALGVTRQAAHAMLTRLAYNGFVTREQRAKITPYMLAPVLWHAKEKEHGNI
mgnify:CR=1 FL=1